MKFLKKLIDFIISIFDSVPKDKEEELVNKIFSENGINMLIRLEALILQIYKDQAGLPTIGVGHLIVSDAEKEEFKNGITKEKAIELLKKDIASVEKTVNESIKVVITQEQFDALVIFVFNIGENGFKSSSAFREINNAASFDIIGPLWKLWNKITINGVKQVSQGLVNRRNAEWELYSKGIYC